MARLQQISVFQTFFQCSSSSNAAALWRQYSHRGTPRSRRETHLELRSERSPAGPSPLSTLVPVLVYLLSGEWRYLRLNLSDYHQVTTVTRVTGQHTHTHGCKHLLDQQLNDTAVPVSQRVYQKCSPCARTASAHMLRASKGQGPRLSSVCPNA